MSAIAMSAKSCFLQLAALSKWFLVNWSDVGGRKFVANGFASIVVIPSREPVMVNNMYTEDDFVASAEYFSITPVLRWNGGVLEQKWQGSQGSERWEVVPTDNDN